MGVRDDYIDLVAKARLDDKESLNRLAEAVAPRLRTYVYRITLDSDLTNDVVQECMLEMFRVLGKLNKKESFWPWLYTVALNKIKRHYKTTARQESVYLSEAKLKESQNQQQEGIERLIKEELQTIVLSAMRSLKPDYRAILAMRCYENMPYQEISKVTGRSEFACRVLFCRAKRSLEKQLSRQGLGKGVILTALVFFGQMTSTNEAAAAGISVAPSALKAGLAAELACIAGTKTAIVSIAAAGLITAGTIITTNSDLTLFSDKTVADGNYIVMPSETHTENITEYWHYFPAGTTGTVMIIAKANGNTGEPYIQIKQNEDGNFQYDIRKNTVSIENYRMWREDLRVWRLPTDSAELSDFITKMEGINEQRGYVHFDEKGLLVIQTNGGTEKPAHRLIVHKNLLEEEYFKYNLPKSAALIDNRDIMHKLGWTYFKIEGKINGEAVSGTGRIPFVYVHSDVQYPWVRLRTGGREFMDSGFAGFGRPWMGLHTIDTIRRDAAERKMNFKTRIIQDTSKAEVEIICGQNSIIYTIDMKKDLIDKIKYVTTNGPGKEGELIFTYIEDVENAGEEFTSPKRLAQSNPLFWETLLKE